MRAGGWAAAAAGVAVAWVALAGCAGKRIEQGVFHSPKGYRVTVPPAGWVVVDSSEADLELRHPSAGAGILVNATCEGRSVRRPAGLLARRLTAGLRARRVVEQGAVSLNGRPAAHLVLEGHLEGVAPVRVETFVVTDGACVYDLVYAAPPEAFPLLRPAFERLVASFTAGGH